jgi:hypothetical protein
MLAPTAQGFGTHEQLGLPPCAFFRITGFPCPSCGLTTCFAHAARLHLHEAFITQPFGLLLFLFVVLTIPLAGWLIYRGVPLRQLISAPFAKPAFGLLLTLYLLGWFYKLAVMN